MFLRII